MTPVEYLNWQDFERGMYHLAAQVNHTPARQTPLVGIYAPPRGGMAIALRLSHLIKIPILAHPTDNCLIVDDIFDSGNTLRHLWDSYCKNRGCIMAVWVINRERQQECKEKNILWVEEKEDGKWLTFIWETR